MINLFKYIKLITVLFLSVNTLKAKSHSDIYNDFLNDSSNTILVAVYKSEYRKPTKQFPKHHFTLYCRVVSVRKGDLFEVGDLCQYTHFVEVGFPNINKKPVVYQNAYLMSLFFRNDSLRKGQIVFPQTLSYKYEKAYIKKTKEVSMPRKAGKAEYRSQTNKKEEEIE